MKTFRDYLKEDVVPTAIVQDGSIDLDREVVRAQINSSLASVLADPSVTPYNALVRASKVLSYFSIILPKRVYLDGEKGIEAIELRQFGDRMGMTDQGEFIKEVPGKFYLFISYGRVSPLNITYAKPTVGGMFKVSAKIVDKVELDRLIDMAEVSLAESAEGRQAMAKARSPKEDMHTALGDCDCSQGDSPSTKSAVSIMMRRKDKKLAAGELDEAMTRKQKNMAVRSFMSHDPKAGESILAMGKKEREEKKSFASAKKEIKRLKEEEQIDEMNQRKETRYKNIIKVSKNSKGETRKEKESSISDKLGGDVHKGEIRRALKKQKYGKKNILQDKKDKERKAELDHLKMFDIKAYWKKKDMKEETLDEGGMPASVIASKQKYANMSDKDFAEKHGHKTEKELRDMAARHGYGFDKATKTGSDHYVKRVSSAKQIDEKHLTPAETRKKEEIVKSMKKGLEGFKERYGKRAKAVMYATATKRAEKIAEDTDLDEAMGSAKKNYGLKKMKTKAKTIVRRGLGKERPTQTILVTKKGDPHAAAGGGVRRIPKDKYDPKIHNMASE